MKKVFTFILILLSNTSYGNAIDSIKTKKDVAAFFHKYIVDEDNDYNFLFDLKYTHGADSFYIVDVDKNGYNDLIVDAASFIVILNNGNNKYRIRHVYGNVSYNGIRQTGSSNQILVNVSEIHHKYDTALVYRWDNFIEYVAQPSTENIHRIEFYYHHGFCYNCSSLTKMAIDSNGTATFYYTNKANKPVKSTIRLSLKEFKQFEDLLNYAHFESIPNIFGSAPMDAAIYGIRVFYDNGNVKKSIVNWGDGSITYRAVTSYFVEWSEQQKLTNGKPFPPDEDESDFFLNWY